MHAALRVLLIVALLYAQAPCGAAFGSAAPCSCHADCHAATPATKCDCGCCDEEPVAAPADVLPADERQPCSPTDCPANCPCAVCSAGYVPLTDFAVVTLPVHAAVGPSLAAAAPSRGDAGHRQLPDRPPRLV